MPYNFNCLTYSCCPPFFVQICLFFALVIGAFTLGSAPHKYLSLIWGFFIGAILGWFYPLENLFFSCILPKGQEAEIAGFRVYCSFLLSWLPPLIFSVIVDQGYDAKWCVEYHIIRPFSVLCLIFLLQDHRDHATINLKLSHILVLSFQGNDFHGFLHVNCSINVET